MTEKHSNFVKHSKIVIVVDYGPRPPTFIVVSPAMNKGAGGRTGRKGSGSPRYVQNE